MLFNTPGISEVLTHWKELYYMMSICFTVGNLKHKSFKQVISTLSPLNAMRGKWDYKDHDTAWLNTCGLEINGARFKSPAFLRHPIWLPLVILVAFLLPRFSRTPHTGAAITIPGEIKWIVVIFSSRSLPFMCASHAASPLELAVGC